ncbi:MAG: hypothetical protein JO110_08860 [Acetobacteraceae bacterium]|nr:hypothetical protein [Acetobacteraceae bacterium]
MRNERSDQEASLGPRARAEPVGREPKPVRDTLLRALQRLSARERVVPRVFPGGDFLIALGRFGAGCPALILLSAGIVHFCDALEAFVIVLSTCVITFSGREIGLLLGDSAALGGFHKAVEGRVPLKAYGLRDYFPSGLAANIVRDHRVMSPDYTILHAKDYGKYTTFQYSPQKSLIVVPFEPDRSSPISLFHLLRELGRIGKKGYLARGAGCAVVWHVASAVTPLFLFASPGSWHAYVLWVFVTGAVVRSSLRGVRLESEIEADHLALVQVFFSWCVGSLADQFSRSGVEILADPQTAPPNDQESSEDDRLVRNEIFEKMRADARNSELTFVDYYIWLGVRSREYKPLVVAAAVLLAVACLEPLHRVGVGCASLVAAVLFLLLALLLSAALKYRNLARVNSLIHPNYG